MTATIACLLLLDCRRSPVERVVVVRDSAAADARKYVMGMEPPAMSCFSKSTTVFPGFQQSRRCNEACGAV